MSTVAPPSVLPEPTGGMADLPPGSPPVRIRRPVMVQQWTDVVFVHWRVDPHAVRSLLPPGVEVDTFDGSAWVGLVPFSMQRLGVPGPSGRRLPLVRDFAEVNVRTYVRAGQHRGVWFFSLDVDSVPATAAARLGYRLPYCWGEVAHSRVGDELTTAVHRRWPRAGSGAGAGPGPSAELVVRVGEPADATDPFRRFLTARWGLVAGGGRGVLRWAPVEHPTWPLWEASVLRLREELVAAAGLPEPAGEPHVMWSPGVPVRVGRPVPIT